jgi:hypothetical protein
MPRIPLVSEATMTDAQRRVYDAMMSGPRRSPRWDRLPPPCTDRTWPKNGRTSAWCCASTPVFHRGCGSSSFC